jgi:hypothetical protein
MQQQPPPEPRPPRVEPEIIPPAEPERRGERTVYIRVSKSGPFGIALAVLLIGVIVIMVLLVMGAALIGIVAAGLFVVGGIVFGMLNRLLRR